MTDDELQQLVASLSEQVQRLEDIEQIKKLQRSYVRFLTDHEWEAALDAFTENAVVDVRDHGPRRGREEVARLFAGMHAHDGPRSGYVLSSPVVEVAGDTASGLWTLHCHWCDVSETDPTVRVYGPWYEGRYRCTYRREAGRWRISRMNLRVVLPDRDLEPDAIEAPAERGEKVISGADRSS
ncbi:nuclear transport factor 2 family protein [Frankia sp. Cr1]|uniref:nuclear transport factor 2 family protein n=1 Tax=Frankia sp. Cr1 TaxID=3073931 RepID=UPI002AD37748|nr:nuclear transport factor 2 family protein [Frankia sp. Cr1]